MANIVTEFVQILTSGITEMAKGLGSGVNAYISDLFLKTGENGVEGLSVFGGVVAVFGGITLAITITTLIFNWLKGLGA